jgi:hypothetical protein
MFFLLSARLAGNGWRSLVVHAPGALQRSRQAEMPPRLIGTARSSTASAQMRI